MRRVNLVMLVMVLTLIGGFPAMAGGGSCHEYSEGESAEVVLEGNCFVATVTRVPVGTTITWRNADTWEHDVFATAFASSDILAPGSTFSSTFEKPGVYPYVCTLHPGMMGTVVVGDLAQVEAPTVQAPTNHGIPAVGGAGLLILGLLGGWGAAHRRSAGGRT